LGLTSLSDQPAGASVVIKTESSATCVLLSDMENQLSAQISARMVSTRTPNAVSVVRIAAAVVMGVKVLK
jgi:hypothetical protein